MTNAALLGRLPAVNFLVAHHYPGETGSGQKSCVHFAGLDFTNTRFFKIYADFI